MCSPLSFHFFYVTLKAEEILYLSKKKSEMENRSLVTIADHSKEKIMYLLRMAGEFEKHTNRKLLEGKVVATLFFEPSTRTRLSFETAANRLGARVIGFTDPKVTSSTKGETLKDTIMMVSNYADLIVMRHYLEGAARYASEVSPVPIINAGDGANQHPSQTMLDLYSIYKTQGTLDNLQIYMVGDLKYGRTVHSLLMAMRHFNPTFHFIAPEELKMPDVYKPAQTFHAEEGQGQYAYPASAPSRERNRVCHRRRPACLLLRAGPQRSVCAAGFDMRCLGADLGRCDKRPDDY